MKAVLQSIKPKYCELIASGKKTLEVRKTKSNLPTPFKVYIYCTKGGDTFYKSSGDGCIRIVKPKYIHALQHHTVYNGKVIGTYICDEILPISITYSDPNTHCALKEFPGTGLTDKQIMDYLGNGVQGYAWHISNLVIYDEPKELSEFYSICPEWEKEEFTAKCNKCKFYNTIHSEYRGDCAVEGVKHLNRPPQSWCYVEELKNEMPI